VSYNGLWRAVDPGGVVDEVLQRVHARSGVRRVAGVQKFQAGAVQVYPVVVRVVRVLALLASGGVEIHDAVFLVDVIEPGRDELAVSDPVLQLARVRIIEIEMRPAIALRPEHQLLAVVHQPKGAALDVGVETLFDERLHLPGPGVDDADVQLVHVTAHARQVQRVG